MRIVSRIAGLSWIIFLGVLERHFLRFPSQKNSADWLQRLCCRGLKILNVKVISQGLPPSKGLIVCNHLGYLDILVLSSQLPVCFVAKHEVRHWPLLGWIATLAATCFIDRKRKRDLVRVAREMEARIRDTVPVVLFPEGTSSDGSGLLPFQSSLLAPAVNQGWLVTPAAIRYTAPGAPDVEHQVAWWGEMTFLPHLWRLLALPEIHAPIVWGKPHSSRSDRKRLALELHGEILELKQLSIWNQASNGRIDP